VPALANLQRDVARAILEGAHALPAALFAAGPITPSEALSVHRNTVLAGLAEALALTYPTVKRLVGGAFFDQAALAYAVADPPIRASLSAHGGSFPGFLEAYPPAAGLAYLSDVARLDLALDQAGSAARLQRLFPIEDGLRLSLPVSLALLELQWPADEIRDALEAEDEAQLAAIELQRRARWFAVWRADTGAGLRTVSPAAFEFLGALLAGADAAAALEAAARDAGRDGALIAIQADVFAASFAQAVTDQPRSPQTCST
jgi:hypothetical protein